MRAFWKLKLKIKNVVAKTNKKKKRMTTWTNALVAQTAVQQRKQNYAQLIKRRANTNTHAPFGGFHCAHVHSTQTHLRTQPHAHTHAGYDGLLLRVLKKEEEEEGSGRWKQNVEKKGL